MNKRVDIATADITELLEEGATFKIVVRGYSMLPLLGFGRDTIILRRVDRSEDISGRIAMFRNDNGRIVVHRIIGINGGIVSLRGDGNLYQVEQCKREEIIAVLESVVRESGKEISCTSRRWHRRERLWLSTPLWMRRYALAILRRVADFRNRKHR
ncbi:MAG: S24/S26 family peptidase [Alistipes sp.]|nr:S24/S26 family peptidase [Alistipes sp.]